MDKKGEINLNIKEETNQNQGPSGFTQEERPISEELNNGAYSKSDQVPPPPFEQPTGLSQWVIVLLLVGVILAIFFSLIWPNIQLRLTAPKTNEVISPTTIPQQTGEETPQDAVLSPTPMQRPIVSLTPPLTRESQVLPNTGIWSED